MAKIRSCRNGHVNPERNKWGACVECCKVHRKRWARANPDKRRESQRRWDRANADKVRAIRRRYVYGIAPEEVDALLRKQNNRCAICARPPNGRAKVLVVDHDHATQKVRGLLCDWCNRGLGLFQDDAESLIRAAAYLKKNHDKT